MDGLTSIFTWWAKEPTMSSFARALGCGHSLPEVEWVVLVAGHGEAVAAIAGPTTRRITCSRVPSTTKIYASTGLLASSRSTIFAPSVLTLSELVADSSLI